MARTTRTKRTRTKTRTPVSYAELKRFAGCGSLETKDYPRFHRQVGIVITHYRKRALDYENLSGKYVVDALRYAGVLEDDRTENVAWVLHDQIKRKEEKTVIEVWEL